MLARSLTRATASVVTPIMFEPLAVGVRSMASEPKFSAFEMAMLAQLEKLNITVKAIHTDVRKVVTETEADVTMRKLTLALGIEVLEELKEGHKYNTSERRKLFFALRSVRETVLSMDERSGADHTELMKILDTKLLSLSKTISAGVGTGSIVSILSALGFHASVVDKVNSAVVSVNKVASVFKAFSGDDNTGSSAEDRAEDTADDSIDKDH